MFLNSFRVILLIISHNFLDLQFISCSVGTHEVVVVVVIVCFFLPSMNILNIYIISGRTDKKKCGTKSDTIKFENIKGDEIIYFFPIITRYSFTQLLPYRCCKGIIILRGVF